MSFVLLRTPWVCPIRGRGHLGCYEVILVSTHIGVFLELTGALESLRKEEFTWDEDINFLQSFVRDPTFKALTEVNDRVANSIGFENPVGATERAFHEVGRSHYNYTLILWDQ